jgi:septal ring factor EnvC (AmiA/AmiB activator)
MSTATIQIRTQPDFPIWVSVIQHYSKEVSLVKILEKFLLSSVFVFLPAVGCAQNNFDLLLGQINKVQRECEDRQFELEMKVQDQQKDIDKLKAKLGDTLENKLLGDSVGDNLADTLRKMQEDIRNLRTNIDLVDEKTTDNIGSPLYQINTRLMTIETKLRTAEDDIQALQSESRIPSHTTNRKTAANKSSGFIPDNPATTPHPASKKSDASKPKALVNKPKPAVKEGTAGGPGIK